MAKMTLSKNAFTIVPEGTHIFKVVEVNDEKYEDFDKLEVKLQNAKGQTHIERFTFRNAKDELNETTLKVWSYFARTCLGNFNVEEIDTQDIVGCYIQATVKHETYTRTKGERAGEEATSVRLNDYTVASGFTDKLVSEDDFEDADDDDLDGFLDD